MVYLNVDRCKFKVLTGGSQFDLFSYSVNGEKLELIASVCDLATHIDSKLT